MSWANTRLLGLLVLFVLVAACVGNSSSPVVELDNANYREVLSTSSPEDVWIVHVTSEQTSAINREVWSNVMAEHGEKLGARYRLATIDYDGPTEVVLTQWGVWRTPYLVVVRDQGRTLNFLSARTLSNRAEQLYLLFETDAWQEYSVPWTGPLAPGGWLYPYMGKVGEGFAFFHSTIGRLPSWLVFILAAGIGKLLRDSIHRDRLRATEQYTQTSASAPSDSSKSADAKQKPKAEAPSAPVSESKKTQ